jgi:hypothetical protein
MIYELQEPYLSSTKWACAVFSYVALRDPRIFPHFLTNCKFFDKILRKITYVLRFSLQCLSEIFAILRSSERIVIKVEYWSSCKAPVIVVRLYWILNYLDRVSKINQMLTFMKILPAESQLIHADRPTVGRTDWWTDGQYWQKQYALVATLERA